MSKEESKTLSKFVIKFAKGSGLNRRDSVEWRGRMQHSTVRLSLCPECRCQTDFYGPHRSEREAEFLLRWNLFTHRLPAPFQKILPSWSTDLWKLFWLFREVHYLQSHMFIWGERVLFMLGSHQIPSLPALGSLESSLVIFIEQIFWKRRLIVLQTQLFWVFDKWFGK